MIRVLEAERIKFFNGEYIENNTIDNRILESQGIELYPNEIFVRYSDEYSDYFISPYERAISYKQGLVTLLQLQRTGKDKQYLSLNLYQNGRTKTITINRAIADVYCPNYWLNDKTTQAHHCDCNTHNNQLDNIVLLPKQLHEAIHKIKSIELLQNGTMQKITNPLDLIIISNGVLTLEDIILADKDKRRKPIKSKGGRTVFNIKGYQIAYKYSKPKGKTKKSK